jgi:hypothetical protein
MKKSNTFSGEHRLQDGRSACMIRLVIRMRPLQSRHAARVHACL